MCGRAWSVLVFDDFPDAGEALAAWLTLEGWHAESVMTPDEALERIDAQAPDVVVIEPYSRHGSGMSLAALIRNRLGAGVWMIAVTAHPRVGDVTAYEPTPFDRTLFKPMEEGQLRAALADARSRWS
ncbi:response regulator [Roseateles chitinivorans]|uniref:response regulator n=1 Tax=Roseateles chitinivorans TaxID=2917965 RepID=UPI003D67B1A6